MIPQYLAAHLSSNCGFEAFESQSHGTDKKVGFLSGFSAIFAQGYPQVACISNEGEVRDQFWFAASAMSRSDLCQRASKFCLALAWQLSYPHALSKRHKKKLSWLTQRRSIPARSTQASTSNTTFGRAAMPVRFPALGAAFPMCRRRAGEVARTCIC